MLKYLNQYHCPGSRHLNVLIKATAHQVTRSEQKALMRMKFVNNKKGFLPWKLFILKLIKKSQHITVYCELSCLHLVVVLKFAIQMAESTETECLKLVLMGMMVLYSFKLWFFSFWGGGGVGKTNITMRLINSKFKDYYNCTIEIEDLYMKHNYMTEINYIVEIKDYYFPTVEDSYMNYNYMVDEVPISLEITDTAGQDTSIGSRIGYYQHNDGFVFVYSVTDRLLVHPHCIINDCHGETYFFQGQLGLCQGLLCRIEKH